MVEIAAADLLEGFDVAAGVSGVHVSVEGFGGGNQVFAKEWFGEPKPGHDETVNKLELGREYTDFWRRT